ncbi:MAG: hypothetical protein IJA76_01000 [Clostridia bacterium]|nr:hypothetical protein [Clostridia bacterium]
MENKHKHLDYVQGVITRMSSNSFALKGWAVTLIAGIFVLAGKDTDKMYFLVAYIPILVFWGLDAFYLLQERLYRSLYNKVRNMNESEIDFSMNAHLEEFKTEKNTWLSCMFSKTEFWFYIPLALVSTGIIILSAVS